MPIFSQGNLSVTKMHSTFIVSLLVKVWFKNHRQRVKSGAYTPGQYSKGEKPWSIAERED